MRIIREDGRLKDDGRDNNMIKIKAITLRKSIRATAVEVVARVILMLKIGTKVKIMIKVMIMVKVMIKEETVLPNSANKSDEGTPRQLSPAASRNPIIFCPNANREKTLSNEVNLLRDSVSVAYAPSAPPGG